MLPVKNNTPYPEPRVEKTNTEYAKMLMQDYAGDISESTAINLYMFQHFTSQWTEFKDIIKQISIVEMKHFELLAETINLLGVKPVYKTFDSNNDTLIPWTSDNVNYETDIVKALEIDLKSENKAIEIYKHHIEAIDDKYVKKLLERIIEDEEDHVKIFEYFLEKAKRHFE